MNKGQTLVMLLVFMIIGITATSASAILLLINSTTAQKIESKEISFATAESGAENALLRLLRNPSYTGETLSTLNGGTVTSTVTGSNPYTITSTSAVGDFSHVIEIVVNYNGNMSIVSWKEKF